MNTHIRRRFVRQFSVILGAGLLTLLLGSMAGAITLSHAESIEPPPGSPSQKSRINHSLPGAQSGVLRVMTETTAVINNTSYTLPPGFPIETTTGRTLRSSPGWEKHLSYPLYVRYWLGSNNTSITQMVVLAEADKSASAPGKK